MGLMRDPRMSPRTGLKMKDGSKGGSKDVKVQRKGLSTGQRVKDGPKDKGQV